MFVCFCATPNILLTLITWSLGEIMHLVRVFPHLLLHSDWSDGGIFVSHSFHRPVVMWQSRSPVRFCSPLNCSDWPVSVISLLPPSLDLLQHSSCSCSSQGLCILSGERRKTKSYWDERDFITGFCLLCHMHTPTFTLWNKEWCQEWPQQEVAQGLDQQYKTLWGLCSSLYSKVHTVSLERIFFRKFGVFNIRDTMRNTDGYFRVTNYFSSIQRSFIESLLCLVPSVHQFLHWSYSVIIH